MPMEPSRLRLWRWRTTAIWCCATVRDASGAMRSKKWNLSYQLINNNREEGTGKATSRR
jgi:hypothetical protein